MSSRHEGLETPNFQKPMAESVMTEFFPNEKSSKQNIEQITQEKGLEEEVYRLYEKVQMLPLSGESEEE